MNLGMDFGSTYTTLSIYREKNDAVEAMEEVNSPNIPSVVTVWEDGRVSYGKAAKNYTGRRKTKTYKAFKMLLPEKNAELLRERGFTGEQSPVKVTTKFLDYCLRAALKNYEQEKIENLVICAPEIWSAAVDTADGRPILRDICKSYSYVDNIQVVSEPAAASAFFAHNYKTMTGKLYNGFILLIDYGGGTLDITLTEVLTSKHDAEAAGMEIKVRERTGAGENEEHCIGKAGVAFMESVVKQAILDKQLAQSEEDIPNDSAFLRTTDDLELELISRVSDIGKVFDEYGTDELDELAQKLFVTLEYGKDEIDVSYATLVNCYNRVIRPVLAQKLNYMMNYMRRQGIGFDNPNADDFKIALVGGFGNFYLVEQQIKKIFTFTQLDRRRNIITGRTSDRELAVSFGAALIASGEITIRSTAPYSIGIYATNKEGVNTRFAINCREEIEYDKPYYQCSENGKRTLFFTLKWDISELIINTTQDIRSAIIIPLKDELRERLQDLVTCSTKTAYIGFSLDQSEVLSIHITEYDFINKKIGDTKKIELSRFNELLDITVFRPLVQHQ